MEKSGLANMDAIMHLHKHDVKYSVIEKRKENGRSMFYFFSNNL